MAELNRPRLFVFGLGYSALAAARLLKGQVDIAGTTRDAARLPALKAAGIDALPFDGVAHSAEVAAELTRATHVLVSVPPGERSDPVLMLHGEDIAEAPGLRWIGYLSSVAVYGNYGGAWVSERTTPHPKTERAVRRHRSELEWRRLGINHDIPVAIFRIAGIYGPGRNAFVALSDGRAHRVVKPGQVFNRIHVDDIAAAVAAALLAKAAGIFNLADDMPSPPEDVVTHAAQIMGVQPPAAVPIEEAELTPMARSFYADNKRVDNRRLKSLLGRPLAYPDYRQGLQALWSGGQWKAQPGP
jgi:nucleoside-diphosphate-sugar epimerase